LKIASAFKFSPDAEFILTYTDEDGDVVMLDDDNDLRDAAINQKLNPLRINVRLKSRNVLATQAKQQATNSKSPTSVSLEGQLAQVKSAIDEALKFVPEQVPAILAKLSHDLRFRAASSTPSLAELLDRCGKLITRSSNIYRCAKLITRSSNLHPPCGFADSSQKLGSAKVKLESALVTGSASETSNGQNSGISETGLRGEDPNAKIEQAPPCPSVRDSLVFTSSGGMKGDHKSIDSEIKFTSDACSKGKSVLSSWPLVSTIDMQPLFPSPPVYEPTPFFTPFNPISGANGKTTGDLHSTFHPPLNIYSPIKLNTPSSVGTCCPNLYSNGSSHGDRTGSLSSYVPNTEGVNSFGSSYRGLGANYRGTPLPHAQHRWIQCDGCGVTPIVGPRYKSNV
jgi:next-to-BRCA1 protein 1